jgi:hypothetical protein
MLWIIIIAVLFAVALAYAFGRKTKREEGPHVTYVCDVCGEKDCECHKIDTEDGR